MLEPLLGTVLLGAALLVFVGLGLSAGRDDDVESYISARGTQGPLSIGLSFLAAGLGAWILFAPPEVGAGVGLLGVLGYAVGAGLPVLLFGLLGRRIRRAVPEGHSIGEFARLRYGRGFAALVFLISVGYMFFFVTAELTSVAGVTGIVAGVDARLTVLAVAGATLVYTTWGGLRASLVTDRWQAGLIVALVAVGFVAAFGAVDGGGQAIGESGLLGVSRVGWEVALTLVIAVASANMFHQGYWQRVWAASDEGVLRRGAGIGVALTVPVVVVLGLFGILAAGSGQGLDVSPVPFFALTTELSTGIGAVVLVLGVSLVASSVDTLETGLFSLIAAEVPGMTMGTARLVTVAVMVPAVVVAFQGLSVLRLFLIADLLCAGVVVPLLAGLWSRVSSAAAMSGALAGLAGAVVPGLISTGSLVEALRLASFPGATPTLPPFLGALGLSALVTFAVSLAGGDRRDGATVELKTTDA
ncbi:sodium:solute symporter [Euzebya tangerina]|uniref:sodium:solute symporter n=1 Tax=Euzebya tangerina TaxID=591198 RepID=UPI000E3225C7|nr:sodium:solute symporter [Euzebya tangerina]